MSALWRQWGRVLATQRRAVVLTPPSAAAVDSPLRAGRRPRVALAAAGGSAYAAAGGAAAAPAADAVTDAAAGVGALLEPAASAASTAAVAFTSSHPGGWLHLWPPYGIAKAIEAVHVLGGAEWWLAVAVASAALRVVALPFFLRTAHTGALMQHHQVAMSGITDELAVARKAEDAERMRALTAQYRALLSDKGIHLGRGVFVPLVVQTTLAISAFTATRHLAADAALVPGVADAVGQWLPGGVGVPDPTYALPAAAGLLSVASISLNKTLAGLPQAELTPQGQRLLFSGFALLFSGVTAAMPASQQIYIAVTAAFMLLQQSALRLGAVKKALDFPHDWPLSADALNERVRRRELLGLDTSSPITDNLKGFAGFFRRVSDVADGTWRRRPVHSYISVWGLRDPGAPLPPAGDPPHAAAAAPSSSQKELVAASAAGGGAVAVPVLRVVDLGSGGRGTSAAAGTGAGTGAVLLAHRPRKAGSRVAAR